MELGVSGLWSVPMFEKHVGCSRGFFSLAAKADPCCTSYSIGVWIAPAEACSYPGIYRGCANLFFFQSFTNFLLFSEFFFLTWGAVCPSHFDHPETPCPINSIKTLPGTQSRVVYCFFDPIWAFSTNNRGCSVEYIYVYTPFILKLWTGKIGYGI